MSYFVISHTRGPNPMATENLSDRHPSLPESLPMTLIAEVLTHASKRVASPGGQPGVKIWIKQIDGVHLHKSVSSRITDELVVVSLGSDGKQLILSVDEQCLSPYTLAGAQAFYEWLWRSKKRIDDDMLYGNPQGCEFHRFARPRGQ